MTSDVPSIAGALAAFAGGAFALVRFALTQARTITERFVGYLEDALKRQEAINERFEHTIAQLSESVRENSALLARVVERMAPGAER